MLDCITPCNTIKWHNGTDVTYPASTFKLPHHEITARTIPLTVTDCGQPPPPSYDFVRIACQNTYELPKLYRNGALTQLKFSGSDFLRLNMNARTTFPSLTQRLLHDRQYAGDLCKFMEKYFTPPHFIYIGSI